MNFKNYTLDFLREKYRLSKRAYNTCKKNGLTDLECLMHYYRNQKDFTKLPRCGVMSDFELKQMCEKYMTANN